MEVFGINGRLELCEDRIKIKRLGGTSPTIQGLMGKYILLSQISSIQFKEAGLLHLGYIQFVLTGEQESEWDLRSTPDENTVTFEFFQQKYFEQIKEAIERAMAIRSKLEGLKPPELAKLEKLSRLKDQGVFTEEEFNRKKQRLLGI